MKKVLAIASGGGHWKQLMLIKDAFNEHQVKYVTTIDGLPQESNIEDYRIVTDSNKSNKFKIFITLFELFKVINNFRPDLIITTGAAPGALAILLGRFFSAKTIWIDSIANGEELSLGGKISKLVAHEVYSQWEDVALKNNVKFEGSVF